MGHIDMEFKTLNHYYSHTDKSKVYHIAMVLHPRLKLSYFKTAHWEDEWIKTTEKVIRDEFKHSYMTDTADDIMVIEDVTPDSCQNPKSSNVFDNLPALTPPKPTDQGSKFDCYLHTGVEHVTNLIAWWHEQHGSYPCLSCMALRV
ncbi:hypothetical protein SCLCIDRAFT_34876 [Scleroderma citrinum Foug A]|uniref:HAT C-terminal dimerisation domain-containing protein n=1 Tax=Scleroderma citrinum Foug A TaxID=1036808 RepID=A0A0C2YJL5_9AGAM|nr:hypothetical protein SCLCIDRAFT_34876 [Scleroderma citrinum Foug A]